ncbi:hypothetical protein [Cyanobium sp. CH-040]|uniref:hypothetical protein n=1 Tax=Cyanobium sp. CH-040 TaxID=2823708 RepID=UPI0020CFC212|nr:hypothetical protein [Cyanobium sp. CH-040]MCP9928203.1 hypothetical protein [Cyanobium sp. CH-040]
MNAVLGLLQKRFYENLLCNPLQVMDGPYILGGEISDKARKDAEHFFEAYTSTLADLSSSVEPPPPEKLPRVQVSLSHGLYYLLKFWATAERRNLAALAGEVLDRGIRDMLRDGLIPVAAVEKYNNVCRIQLETAEVRASMFGDTDTNSLDPFNTDEELQ